MDTVRLILILLVFFGGIALMMSKKLPAILALPLIGILVPIIAGVPLLTTAAKDGQTVAGFVIVAGSARLADTIIVTIFGAIFAKVIDKQGIADGIIRKAAELAGDKPVAMAFALTAAVALIFVGMSGAGPVIMVCTIAVPLMLTAGISAVDAASLILLGMTIGLSVNVSQYQVYIDTLGVTMAAVKSMSIIIAIVGIFVTAVYILFKVRKTAVRSSWAMEAESKQKKPVPLFALFTPVLPFILVFFAKLDASTALILSIVLTVLITTPKKMSTVLAAAVVEGIKDVAAVIGLMIGIGILLNGVTNAATTGLIKPLVTAIMPSSPLAYVIVFTLLSPLALYRGPMNMFGLGSGLATIMLAAGTMNPAAVTMALRSTTFVQTASDPTNTQNVICADYAQVDVNDILKATLPWTMIICFITLIYSAVFIY
ncbi:transporter [Lacticaseibacillus hegangensis]|uniref:Citrate transporter n=1 Tax=Lacticaseibacillus hegangensis TaxID=2486010 RepID=A0ABW4CVB2_9LACO|nr:transporter [Lacticaseibacillus hegangensis]